MDDIEIKRTVVTVGSYATDWISITPKTTWDTLNLVIPGNPGIVRYYEIFCKELYQKLEGRSAVWAISHTCHTEKDSTPNSTVSREVQHKLNFIQKFVPVGTKLRLIGHSIGCQMILKGLDDITGTDSQVSLLQAYFLFPTIERMRVAPRGQTLWPILNYFWWLPPLLGGFVSFMPNFIKERCALLATGTSVNLPLPPPVKQSLMLTLQPTNIGNMLSLAYDELKYVEDIDIEAVRKYKDKITFYYGATDHWTPLHYRDELRSKVEGVKTYVCEKGIEHAFVLTQSQLMAQQLNKIITDIE